MDAHGGRNALRELFTGVASAFAVLAVAPAMAGTNLECINEGYTEAQEQVFEDYVTNFTIASLDEEEDKNTDSLIEPISARAVNCTLEYGWSEDDIFNAVSHRMASLFGWALEVHTPLTDEQMGNFQQAMENADQARLRQVLGPQLEASMYGGEAPEMSDEDKVWFGLIVLGAGLPQDETSLEYVGLLTGARMMTQIAAEKFYGE